MSDSTQESSLSREERIGAVLEFSGVLAETLQAMEETGGKISPTVRAAFSAECVMCGSCVTGEELLAVADTSESAEVNANIERLRLGQCIRQGCDAARYRLIFQRIPGLNWRTIFERMEEVTAARKETARTQSKLGGWLSAHWRIAVGVGLILLVLLIRQWYLGGRIPLIREPEKFRVDPLPPGQTEPNALGVH